MENNEMNANVRTLIVCFVLGVFSLIPLRFYEAAQMGAGQSNAYVLGEQDEVVLPEVVETVEGPAFEAPYDEIESQQKDECMQVADMEKLANDILNLNVSDAEKDSLLSQLAVMNICE